MAEVATDPSHRSKLVAGTTLVTEEMVQPSRSGSTTSSTGCRCRPSSWCPGPNRASAALDLARTSSAAPSALLVSSPIDGSLVGQYLNRLSDLLWALARWAEGEDHLLARGSPRRRSAADRRSGRLTRDAWQRPLDLTRIDPNRTDPTTPWSTDVIDVTARSGDRTARRPGRRGRPRAQLRATGRSWPSTRRRSTGLGHPDRRSTPPGANARGSPARWPRSLVLRSADSDPAAGAGPDVVLVGPRDADDLTGDRASSRCGGPRRPSCVGRHGGSALLVPARRGRRRHGRGRRGRGRGRRARRLPVRRRSGVATRRRHSTPWCSPRDDEAGAVAEGPPGRPGGPRRWPWPGTW